jgi:hypothetical protein
VRRTPLGTRRNCPAGRAPQPIGERVVSGVAASRWTRIRLDRLAGGQHLERPLTPGAARNVPLDDFGLGLDETVQQHPLELLLRRAWVGHRVTRSAGF